MWNIKCLIIPVVIEATGMVTKGVKKNVEAMPVAAERAADGSSAGRS